MKFLLHAFIYFTISAVSAEASSLAEWNFSDLPATSGTNNLPATDHNPLLSVVPTLKVSNTSSSSPISPFYNPEGIWAVGTSGPAVNLAEALAIDRFIEFTLEPESGYELNLISLILSISVFNLESSISIFSSLQGFEIEDVIDTHPLLATDTANPQEIMVSLNHTGILAPVTVRIYPHNVGTNILWFGDSDDPSISGIEVTGTVPEINTASLAFASLIFLWLSSILYSRRRIRSAGSKSL